MPADPYATEGDVLTAATSIDAGSSAVRDTERLTAALRELLVDADKRKRLHDSVTTFAGAQRRGPRPMGGRDAERRRVRRGDRPTRRAGGRPGLAEQPARIRARQDDGRTRKARSHPAALIEGSLDDEQLVQRLAAITQLAEQLDRGTLDLALRIVPIEWWREQLRASVPASHRAVKAGSCTARREHSVHKLRRALPYPRKGRPQSKLDDIIETVMANGHL